MIPFVKAANVTEVTANLIEIHNRLCAKTMAPKEAIEIHNGAGKISSFLKVQLEYHKMRGEKPEIEFLNAPPTTKIIESDQTKKIDKPKA